MLPRQRAETAPTVALPALSPGHFGEWPRLEDPSLAPVSQLPTVVHQRRNPMWSSCMFTGVLSLDEIAAEQTVVIPGSPRRPASASEPPFPPAPTTEPAIPVVLPAPTDTPIGAQTFLIASVLLLLLLSFSAVTARQQIEPLRTLFSAHIAR